MKICEIFKGIQGEGRYAGVPMLFIRVYGCTRNCWYCDTLYAVEGNKYKEMTIEELVKKIKNSKMSYICFTGGEPLLQRNEIEEITKKIPEKNYHLESNGDLLLPRDFSTFDYLSISPKDKKTCLKVNKIIYVSYIPEGVEYDIKVVTDLKKVGKDLIKYATILMPLTTYDEKKDLEIKKRIWRYCIEHNLRYSPRLQVDLWGEERGK